MSARIQAVRQARRLSSDDIDAVLRIERASYAFPWSERVFRDCLRVGYRCFAMTDAEDRVLGYALLSVVLDEGHILNLCVDPAHRRLGLARCLLERVFTEARHAEVRTLLLEVRPSNHAARALYAAHGFRRLATRPAYYPAANGREDALLMSRDMSP